MARLPRRSHELEAGSARALLDRISEDAHVTRRDYLRILVTVSGGLLAGTAAVAAGVFRRIGLGTEPAKLVASQLAPNEHVYFSYPGRQDQAIALRLPDGRLVAYSAICTHLACSVLWTKESQRLECPCHDGVFEPATGDVLAGPPPRPLPRVRLDERADGIYAVGVGA
jgi:nitrite reductase/ring-hydroxylating ferredoxin subunit